MKRLVGDVLIVAALAMVLSSCSGGHDRAGQEHSSVIPAELERAESATEDTIDLALAGRRDQVEQQARVLEQLAGGPLLDKVRRAGAREASIEKFRQGAARVVTLAPKGDLLSVALASNSAFGAVADFYALYPNEVPATVTRLDYLDFEAKLRAKAGQDEPLAQAVAGLSKTWTGLRPGVIEAGGTQVAPHFDSHVKRMKELVASGDHEATVREAQHGLDLVDELEAVYRR
jgi:hypothetical protein